MQTQQKCFLMMIVSILTSVSIQAMDDDRDGENKRSSKNAPALPVGEYWNNLTHEERLAASPEYREATSTAPSSDILRKTVFAQYENSKKNPTEKARFKDQNEQWWDVKELKLNVMEDSFNAALQGPIFYNNLGTTWGPSQYGGTELIKRYSASFLNPDKKANISVVIGSVEIVDYL